MANSKAAHEADLVVYFDECQSVQGSFFARQAFEYIGAFMDHAEVAKISKALSDSTRLRIYESIAGRGEMFCGEIVERYRLTPGTISHHLKILAEAGLIECRREGQFVYNRAHPEIIREYSRALTKMSGKTKAASLR
jgi:ArsR family transcriptional regulator, arsenate/arsenite/antimonite-responsive transcriptional repressor